MDLSTKPYQTLRSGRNAHYLLLTDQSNHLCHVPAKHATGIIKRQYDKSVTTNGILCLPLHLMMELDLLQNPLIVPVKLLRGHTHNKDLGVLDCHFHPTQPWIFSSGADCTIRLFT
ncbi:hypothetical protein KUTeg_019449 [Tegillarca granosa]|uniref:Uncharacterized protein n=1 Tax=Tegillarca granosa TaxID=220873 RepID=A0ABQ9ECJ8_TEGGR|nr:hypothetical protein KUTeg_019449 [Tegillarca granosa]